MIRDYTDIPYSNLTHVLQGKNVLLMGNKELCGFVEEYLNAVESGDVHIEYVDLEEHSKIEEDVIVCLVLPDYHAHNAGEKDQGRELKDWLTEAGVGYTDYYVSDRALALMELYLNRGQKYSLPNLKPKGILLARYPSSEIFSQFEKLYSEFVSSDTEELVNAIPNLLKFEQSMHRLLKLKERFTSQELFVLFHIAYTEMAYGVQVTEISILI